MPAHKTPPKIAYWLLKIFCRADYLDEVAGDLQELYEWRLGTGKVSVARYRYFLDTFSAIRFYRAGRFTSLITQAMFFSFIKSSFRNFKNHFAYTSLHVLGLALGLAASVYILEYVSDELNYNRSSQSPQLYRVSNDYYRFGEMIYESSLTFSGVGPAMQRDLPEVTDYARLYSPRISRGGSVVLTRAQEPDIHFKEQKLFFADPDYLNFFDLKVRQGINELGKPNTIMLTVEMAEKYFGRAEEAIGKTLLYHDIRESYELVVTGVYEGPDFPLQVDAEALISYSSLEQKNPEDFVNDWGGNSFITFVKIKEQADPRGIEEKMRELTLQYKPSYAEKNKEGDYQRVNRYFLTKVSDIHLNSTLQNEVGPIGDATTIGILQAIALFIVMIAWINFINLSTAKSVERAREVGVRKVMGAQKNELVLQFFTEAVLINCMAVLVALVFVIIGQPVFNLFVEKNLHLHSIDVERFAGLALFIFLMGTMLSGLYPALIISSQRAIHALKGKARLDSGLYLRRGLIIFQLLFSSLLIIATLAIHQQLQYMNNQAMGFDMEEVLILRGPVITQAKGEDNIPNIERFKQQILSIPGVSQIGTSTVIPGQGILRGMAISRTEGNEADMKSIERVVSSNGFLATLQVKFLAGKDFHKGMVGYTPLILNESAARLLGFEHPAEAIGQHLYEFTREKRKIVGVIKDYHHESLNQVIEPMYFVRHEAFDAFYAIRLKSEDVGSSLDRIEEEYQAAFPGNPAEYYFLDQFFSRQYKRHALNLKVFSAFAFLAIVVACLGLFGLSSFSAHQRTKEVAVRKVLGASIPSLFFLLSREVFLLVLIGFVLATPMAWVGIHKWLQAFAYRMPVGAFLFIFPLLLIMIITLLATGITILRVTLSNPVKSLRYE